MILNRGMLALVLLFWGSVGFSQSAVPECVAKGSALPINNQDVSTWKTTTKDQYKNRGHVAGMISQIYADHSGHHHIEVTMAVLPADTIEIIYNEKFGALPSGMAVGSKIEACGDYITAQHQSGGYSASPDGAILHWVHRSPNTRHDSGFVVIDGTVCGQN